MTESKHLKLNVLSAVFMTDTRNLLFKCKKNITYRAVA